MKRCLGVGCGEHTGFAILDHPRVLVHCELFRCRNSRHDSSGMKFLLFERRLRDLITQYQPDFVAYEVWVKHSSVYAAQVLGAYMGTLTKVLAEPGMPPGIGLNVQEIKKHATGNQNASKDKMMQAAGLLWPEVKLLSPDVADALHIARRGINKLIS